jgi:hypothetical protein
MSTRHDVYQQLKNIDFMLGMRLTHRSQLLLNLAFLVRRNPEPLNREPLNLRQAYAAFEKRSPQPLLNYFQIAELLQKNLYVVFFFLDIQDKVAYTIIQKAFFRHSTLGEESVKMREVVPKISEYILEGIGVFSLRLLSSQRLKTALLDS